METSATSWRLKFLRLRLQSAFNFLASLINGNIKVTHFTLTIDGEAFNFLASLINGNCKELLGGKVLELFFLLTS